MAGIQEARIFNETMEKIRNVLPKNWEVLGTLPAAPSQGEDFRLVIRSPSGEEATLIVEVKTRLYSRTSNPTVTPTDGRYRMIVSGFIPPAARRPLAASGINFADPTGNVRITLSEPGLVIETVGAMSDPIPRDPKRSLKSASASRVIRALVDTRPPFRLTELSARARVDTGLTSKLLTQFEQEGLLTRQARGPVTEVNWDDLIRRWTQEYKVTKNNAPLYMLEPRGLAPLLAGLRTTNLRYVLTGSVAASMRAAVAPPALAMLYVESPNEIAEAFKLRPARTGGNVVLLVPRDSLPFEGTTRVQELVVAAPSQVAADLLTGPGRSSAEADAFLDWMKENENEWRR